MIRSAAGLTLLTLVLACPAVASTGGVSPSSTLPAVQAAPPVNVTPATPKRSGGVSYGKHFPTPPPVATLFSVTPRSLREGHTPQIAVRIDELHVHRVALGISFIPLRGNGTTLNLEIGPRPTGQRIAIAWPAHATLAAGRYRVVLHATGPHGLTLARRAHASGEATLTVTPKPKPKPKPTPVPTPTPTATPDPAPTPDTGGTFPVQGPHSYGDGIGAAREGHTHQGQDIVAAFGLPVVAPRSGTIDTTGYQASAAGYYVVENADDGRAYFFAHCVHDSIVVTPGQAVSQGQELCHVGQTGGATGPHLHFEIWVNGWRVNSSSHFIDPLSQLQAWDH